jgi:ferritin-like metal-binding protein YciE
MFFARSEHTSTMTENDRGAAAKGILSLQMRKEHDMKLFSANIEDLRTLYISNLKKALDMEQKITKALPDLVEKSSDSTLKTAFSNHLEETRGHVARVEALLRKHIGDAATETCKVINGLTTEASDTIKDVTDPSIRDIALVGAAQQVEHHEIAVYGTLRSWAMLLGLNDDAAALKFIESEEVKADQLLTQISERVNYEAAA